MKTCCRVDEVVTMSLIEIAECGSEERLMTELMNRIHEGTLTDMAFMPVGTKLEMGGEVIAIRVVGTKEVHDGEDARPA